MNWFWYNRTNKMSQTRSFWLNWDLTIWNVGGTIFWSSVIHMSISDLNVSKLQRWINNLVWSSTILKIFHLLDFMFWLVLLKIKWPNWIMIVYKNHILSSCRSQNLSLSAPCYQKFQDQNTNRCICSSCYNILSPNVKW